MVKKILPSIIIALILVNLFAPFSVGVNSNGTAVINKNVAEAAFIEITPTEEAGATNTSIILSFHIKRLQTTGNHGMVYLITDKPGTKTQTLPFLNTSGDETTAGNTRTRISTAFHQNTTLKVLFTPASGATIIKDAAVDLGETNPSDGGVMKDETSDGLIQDYTVTLANLPTTTKNYYVSYAAYGGTADDAYAPPITDFQISTTTAPGEVSTTAVKGTTSTGGGFLPACWLGITSGFSVSGCIAQLLYGLFFQPTSFVFGLTGEFFDYTFFYSTRDTSYRSGFVVQGWGTVRDFVNIFFIFVLLYIAFATILEIHGFKTKEMIINVVIIGLLMNFSLFVTQVIIDTSNILARVFYTTITVSKTDSNGNAIKDNSGNAINQPGEQDPNEVQLSAKIVNMVDPQKLILSSIKVGSINKTGAGDNDSNSNGISNVTFILVTLLATAVNVVGLIVFLSVGLIFVGRVVGLWLAMIFVPFAFFSYTVPAMKEIDMLGWKKWWPTTLKLAFLAPIFIFFIYLIIKFLGASDFLPSLSEGTSGIGFVISIIVPFAIIMVLLTRAKSLAVKFSGEFGAAMTKVGTMAGGLAVGVASGGAAVLGRATIGRAGSALANSAWAKRYEARGGFGGQTLRNLGKAAGSGSMDIRGVKIAGKGLSDTGLKNLGKQKEGGFTKMRADKVIARKKRADELKVGEDEGLKQDLNRAEANLQELLRTSSHDIEQIDKQLTQARQRASDLRSRAANAPGGLYTDPVTGQIMSNTDASDRANDRVENLVGQKSAIKNATGANAAAANAAAQNAAIAAVSNPTNAALADAARNLAAVAAAENAALANGGNSINNLEDHIIPDAHHAIEHENKDRQFNYATYIQSPVNKVVNFIKTGGQHTSAGANEAAHKIRMDAKLDSGAKDHH